jgi:uncharacterized protein YdhG (YjbR/CyaY superfamily)
MDPTPRFAEYLSGLPDDQADALRAVIDHVVAVVPEAEAGHSYGMPAFRWRGRPLLGFAATRDHLGLYPFSPAAIDAVRDRLADWSLSKGTIRFTPDRPVPADALTALLRARLRELDG